MPSYSKQIKSSLTEALFKKLTQYCKDNEKTISEVVREALREYLKEEE